MKKIHIVLVIAIAIMVGVIVTLTFNTTTYGTFADAELNAGNETRVVGTLDTTQPLIYNPQKNPNFCVFYMADSTGVSKKVILHQSKPHDLEKSTINDKIVVNGSFENGEFHVKKVGHRN